MKKYIKYILSTVLLFLTVGCGSKKKTTEINKSVYKEDKDYYLRQLDSMRQEIEYRNAIIALSIEPVDPKIPNTAKFVKTETGFEYEGENSKVGAKSQKEENKVRTEKGSEKEVEDKGEVYASKKEKNIDKEKEWSIPWWSVVLIVVLGGFIIWARSTGRKIKFWQ
jgi:hypothetical protein